MIEFSLSASFRNLCKSSLQYPKNCSRQNEKLFFGWRGIKRIYEIKVLCIYL